MQAQSAHNYIPQKEPFQFVDSIVSNEDGKTVCLYTVTNKCIMLEDSYLSESALLEVMAQTCAAGHGYHAVMNNIPVANGYIGAIKKVHIESKPKVGDTIRCETNTLNQIGNASIVEANIFLEEKLIAHAELTIFVGEN